MPKSRRRGWLRGLLIFAAVVLIGGAAFNYLYLFDLRPDSLVEDTPAAREAASSLPREGESKPSAREE